MSRESSLLRGITQQDMKNVVRKALEGGWELGDMSGTTHASIYWPATGEKVTFGTTTSDKNYYKTMAREIEQISGLSVVPRHSHRRGRKQDKTEKYIDNQRQSEAEQWVSGRLEALLKEHERLVQRFQEIALAGHKAPRGEVNEAIRIVRRIGEIEKVFEEFRQPAPQFDPQNPFS